MDPSDQDQNELGNGAAGSDDRPMHANGTPGDGDRWPRSVVEHSSEMVTIVDPDGTLRYANPAWGRALGHDSRKAVGTMNVLDHVHPDDLPHVLEETEKALAEGGVATNEAEYRFRHADGSWRWVESVGTYLLEDPYVGVVVQTRDVTERKGAEERLRFQARLLDTVGEAVIALDVDGRVSYWNRAAEDLYGWSSEEATGSKLREMVVSDDLRGPAEEIAGQLREGKAWTGEFVVRRRDGSTLYVEGTDTPVFGQDGGLIGVIGVLRDVTERKEAEEALRRSEAELFSVLEGITDAFFSLDHELRFAYVNPQAAVLFSKRREDLIGEIIWEDPTFYPQYVRAVTEGQTVAFEGYYHPSGAWYSVRAYPSGSGLSVYLQDVTERKETEERSHSLVRNASDVILIMGSDQTVRYISPAVERVLGYKPEQVVGQDNLLPVHPDDMPRIKRFIGEVMGSPGNTSSMELRLRHVDSSWRYVETTCTNLLGDPAVGGIVFNTRDITERKEAEDALRESERHFRAITQNSSDIVTLLGATGTIRYQSPSVERILGYGQAEMIGNSAFDYVHPDDLEQVEMAFAEGLADPTRRPSVEYRFRHKDRRWVWLESLGTNRLGDPGVGEYVVTSRNITVRKQAETRLREAEQRYRTLVERVPAVVYIEEVGDAQGTLYTSPQIEGLLGYPQGEWLGDLDHWKKCIHPEDRERVLGEDDRSNATGEPFKSEYRLFHRDGHVVWVHDEAVLVEGPGEGGRIWQGVMTDVTERKALEERLEHQALHDSLTNLPNRRLFMDRLGHALQRTRRQQNRVAVLFMDLDDFKVVNDSLGHEAGDLLLTIVAQRLKRRLRLEDTLARFGGDEFVMLLEDVEDPGEAVRVAQRITDEFRRPCVLEGRELYVFASVGISFGTASTKSPEDLLRDADTAMYQAKKDASGYRVFDPGMYERVVQRLDLENDLRRAVEQEEFVVHYQPIFDFGIQEPWGVEALVRWEHPERGLLGPSEFVPVAEETGLIVPIGAWVLKEACRRTKEWQDSHPRNPPLGVIVNLSAMQLRHPGCEETIREALIRSGLAARSLSLDVTESAFIDALESNRLALERIQATGVGISIDDFGIGYSSLSYLKRLPADALKIDKSFLKGFGEDAQDTAIVRMVIDVAHTLGLRVVAEGVETWSQATLLAETGCDMAQGFHFSEPLPPEAASDFLRSAFRGPSQRDGYDSLFDSD